ncbi:MAG: glutamyl-tRNA reductase, partial [Nitrospinota bacterium]
MPLLVVGLSHKTAPLEIREQLAFEPYQWQEVAEKLDQYSELQEKVLLSTTNRVEVYARVKEVEQGRERIVQFLSDYHGVPERAFRSYLYHFVEGEAIRHLFRVASSLDSMVVGEPQILGQVQEAYNRAKAHGMVGNVLGALFEKSFSVAKRVHTETQIAENAVSISFAAVELAKKIFVDLHHCTAMLIGTGEMAELAAQHLLHHGVRTLLICSRPFERAVAVAERLDGDAIQYDHLFTYLETADIVLGSMPTRHPVLTRAAVQEVIRRRRYRPMFFIDMAAPRNIDPSVNAISNVYLYDVDDLQNVVNTNIRQRQQEAAIAEELVNREAVAFQRWLNSLDVAPTIVSLQQKAESIRQQELSQLLDHLPTLSEQEREAIEAFSIAMVDKLLSTPIMNLRKGVKAPEGNKLLQAVRQLFDLNERWHRPIRIGSRGSSLALRQTEWVQRQLASLFPHITFEKLIIKTSGDVIRDVPLPTVGDKGFFVKEIEEAL